MNHSSSLNVQFPLELVNLVKLLSHVLSKSVDLSSAMFPFISQLEEGLFVLVADRVAQVLKHFLVGFEPIWVFEVFENLRRLDSILGALILVGIVCVCLTRVQGCNVLSDITDLLDEVHIVGHDLKVVSFVDLRLNLKALLERMH